MSAHMCVWWGERGGKKEKVQEWTLIPVPLPRDQLDLHLPDILFHSGIKVDFTEAWRGIQRGGRTQRKCVMMSVVAGAAFGQFGLLSAEEMELFFFFRASQM